MRIFLSSSFPLQLPGDHFIQLERRGLHHINSHVAHSFDDDDMQPPDIMDDSDHSDGFDDDEDGIPRTKMIPTTKMNAKSSENSSDGIQSICLLYQRLSKQLLCCV